MRLTATVVSLGLAGALMSAPASVRAQTPTTVEVSRLNASPQADPVNVTESKRLARKWGIAVESLRLTASGYMLDFRYRVLDARKAKPLFVRKIKPVLKDEATGAIMAVPVPPKTGALRNSNDPKAGRSYFMFFGNPAHFVKPGNRVTITIGEFSVSGVRVETDVPAPTPAADSPEAQHDGHQHHEGHVMPAPSRRETDARVLNPQPQLDGISLVDQAGHATSLARVIATDKPVMLNFIFTSCTTICPVMTTGFAQFQSSLGAKRDAVRLISISIDPDIDTVDTLHRYAEKYGAGASWEFLTGTREAVEAAQRAFGAFRGGKNNHAPVTFFRVSPGQPWQSIDGLLSAGTLMRAYRGELTASASNQ